MLEPEYFSDKADRMIEIYQELEDFIFKDIAGRLLESQSVSGTADRLIWKLEQMGESRAEIMKKLSQLTRLSRRELQAILQDAVMTSWKDDLDTFNVLGKNIANPLDNAVVRAVMDAEYRKSQGELHNLTRTTMDKANQDLIRMLDEVDVRVASGVQSYSAAVCDILDNYVGKGFEIEYPSGTKKTLEAAVRMCVVTSMNQTSAQITNQYIVEGGIEYVLVSAHVGARPQQTGQPHLAGHENWQGKVYRIRGSEPGFPNLAEMTGYDIDAQGNGKVIDPRGLHGYNCRHSHKPWDKRLRNPYVDENGNPKIDTEENRKLYEAQQKQRAMERAVRKTKRELLMKQEEINRVAETDVKEMLQPEYDHLAHKLHQQNEAYNKFCEEKRLQRQSDRLKIVGFKRKQAAQARGRARAYEYRKQKQTEMKPQNVARTSSGRNKVYFNASKSYRIDLQGYPAAVNNGLSVAAKDLAKLGNDTMWEHCKLVNLQTGEIEFTTTDHEFAQVGGFYKHVLKNPTSEYAFIHNHNTGTKLSLPDMQILAGADNIKVVAAVRNDGIITLVESNGRTTSEYLFTHYESQIKQFVTEHISQYGVDVNEMAEEYAVELAVKEFGRGMNIYGD